MSQRAATDFLSATASSPDLLTRLAGVIEDAPAGGVDDRIAALAADAGFIFTGADMRAVREQLLVAADEGGILDGVRGGTGTASVDVPRTTGGSTDISQEQMLLNIAQQEGGDPMAAMMETFSQFSSQLAETLALLNLMRGRGA